MVNKISAEVDIFLIELTKLFRAKSKIIIKRWVDHIIATYPAQSVSFLKKKEDKFNNPIGFIFYNEAQIIFEYLLNTPNWEKIIFSIDRIVRIQALQDCAPSQSLAFILDLKLILREIIKQETYDITITLVLLKELAILENRIDKLMLIMFDIYMNCRKKIYELQAQEVKNMYYNILRQTGIFSSNVSSTL